MSARDDAREGALFLIAGLVAGVGHYGFQILASGQLDAAEFARLSGWLAHLSLGFLAAGLVQYAANFHPVAPGRLKASLVWANLAAGLIAAASVWIDEPLGWNTGAIIVTLAVLGSWASGQAQIRLDFRGLAVAQILTAAVKVLVPIAIIGGLRGYGLAVGLGYLPALWFLTWRLWRTPAVAVAMPGLGAGGWAAPIVIATAANLIPQFDLILTQHTQTPVDFDAFARASLFYKGIYFFVFIFAQWLLPRQIRGGGPRWLGPGLVAGFAGAASVGLAMTAPVIARYVFHWTESPGRGLVLLSCVHMSLLTLIFVQVQSACAGGRVRVAVAMLAALALEAALQLGVAAPTMIYLAAAIVAQSILVIVALRVPSAPPA